MAEDPGKPRRSLHNSSTRVMSALILLLGVAILVSTIARSGFGLTYGVVFGVLFIAAGAGRLWVARKGI
jgi:hypothetical protein